MSATIRGNPLFRRRAFGSSKELKVLPPVFPGSKATSRVHLLAPEYMGESLADRYGIDCNKNGACFQLEDGVHLNRIPAELLPFFARPHVAPFMNDLAPAQSWGGSLAALLTSTSLQPIAEASSMRFGGKCYLCGAPPHAKAPPHAARPWWGYVEPSNNERFGRQYLLAVTPMCRDCADMLQLARAGEAPRLQTVLARLGAVFRFSEAEARQYHDLMERRWVRHNSHFWAVDLSRVFTNATVELQAAWQHSSDSDLAQPVLYRASGSSGKPASLQLRGVKYTVSGNHRVHFHR